MDAMHITERDPQWGWLGLPACETKLLAMWSSLRARHAHTVSMVQGNMDLIFESHSDT